jgi:hypothetical protein
MTDAVDVAAGQHGLRGGGRQVQSAGNLDRAEPVPPALSQDRPHGQPLPVCESGSGGAGAATHLFLAMVTVDERAKPTPMGLVPLALDEIRHLFVRLVIDSAASPSHVRLYGGDLGVLDGLRRSRADDLPVCS